MDRKDWSTFEITDKVHIPPLMGEATFDDRIKGKFYVETFLISEQ